MSIVKTLHIIIIININYIKTIYNLIIVPQLCSIIYIYFNYRT